MRLALLLTLLLVTQDPKPAWEETDFSTAELKGMSASGRLAGNDLAVVPLATEGRCSFISDLVPFKGRLHAATSYDPAKFREHGQILRLATDRDVFEVWRDQEWSRLLNLRVLGDRLGYAEFWMGGAGKLHLQDGEKWIPRGPAAANGLHGMDLCAFDGKLYWAGAVRGDYRKDPKAGLGYGVVAESADDGVTWKGIYRDTQNGRAVEMVIFKDKLHVNRRGEMLIRRDGETWTEIPVDLPGAKEAVLGNAPWMFAFKDRLLIINGSMYYRYDGKTWTSDTPGFIDLYPAGDLCYGLRPDGHVWTSSDSMTWRRITETGMPKEELEGNHLKRGAICHFEGRVIVGGSKSGKFYASAYEKAGSLVSKPHKTGGGLKLDWSAGVPPGAKLGVSWRTGKTETSCQKADWTPIEKPGPVEVPSGHAWMQVRFAASGDGKVSPIIRSVRWMP